METIIENQKHIKGLFENFKTSNGYAERRKQERFSEIARRIIFETLKKESYQTLI